jgi:hypothetical protein
VTSSVTHALALARGGCNGTVICGAVALRSSIIYGVQAASLHTNIPSQSTLYLNSSSTVHHYPYAPLNSTQYFILSCRGSTAIQ